MDITPQIFIAEVMHKRLLPKENSFTYRLYYLLLPLPAPIISNKFVRFNAKDLGYRDGSDPENFARTILFAYKIEYKISHIMLITMPSVLGYVFNPVSFYLCLDQEKQLRAVIAEVHNTFGEQHTYLCAHSDHIAITSDDWLEAEKLFHVSPFLERNGSYRFRFSIQKNKLGIWIDYFDKENNKQLVTSLIGSLQPLNRSSLNKVFWSHPLVTLKTIMLIHWQALKLMVKNIRYIPKPKQYNKKVSITSKLRE
jgi:uncharacterized protein